MDKVAGVAVVPLLWRHAEVVHFQACSSWSDQALAVNKLLASRQDTPLTSTSESEKTFGSGDTHDYL